MIFDHVRVVMFDTIIWEYAVIYIYIIISLHRLQTKSTSVYMCICQNPCARVNFETAGTTCVCFQIDIRIFGFHPPYDNISPNDGDKLFDESLFPR